jgi:hypothetical protein
MSSAARQTYEAVAPVQNTALVAAFQAAESAYDASVGLATRTYAAAGPSGFAAYDASVKTAQRTRVAAELLASHNHQVAIENAKNVLRATGDSGA